MNNQYHLKSNSDGKKSSAYLPTLCGMTDNGTLRYMSFDPSEEGYIGELRSSIDDCEKSHDEVCASCYQAFAAGILH